MCLLFLSHLLQVLVHLIIFLFVEICQINLFFFLTLAFFIFNFLERFYEDHESLVENVLQWGRESPNKLYFMQRSDKYDLFVHPEKYLQHNYNKSQLSTSGNAMQNSLPLSTSSSSSTICDGNHTLKSKSTIITATTSKNQCKVVDSLALLRADLVAQCFNCSHQVKVPQIESWLFLRAEGKKTWKKYFFSLRPSGLYYCVKGKPKSTADLLCLATFEMNCVYFGFGWRKKFKAPNDFGFAIKHPQLQVKSPKQIRYLCAESEEEFRLWITGIRMAKYGRKLLDNYRQFEIQTSTVTAEEMDNQQQNGLLIEQIK